MKAVKKAFTLIVGFLQSLVLVFCIRQKTKQVQLQAIVSTILLFIIAYIYIHTHTHTFIRASVVPQLVKKLPSMQETPVHFLSWEDPLEKGQATAAVLLGFPAGSDGKESACSVGNLDSIPGLGISSGGGHGNPLQYSCLDNPVDRGAWWVVVHAITQSQT